MYIVIEVSYSLMVDSIYTFRRGLRLVKVVKFNFDITNTFKLENYKDNQRIKSRNVFNMVNSFYSIWNFSYNTNEKRSITHKVFRV